MQVKTEEARKQASKAFTETQKRASSVRKEARRQLDLLKG